MAMQLSGSLNLTGSLNVNGSIIGSISATNGIVSSSTQVQNYDVFALNSNLYTSTGSLIGITNELMSYTASLKAAAIVSSSTQVQNYDVFALNSNLYNSTGSIKGEIAGIEAYTASLKGAAIVSSSQQITNYYKFAETASANTFYGTQTISGSLNIGNANTLNIYRTDNTRALQLYTTNDECVINSWEASSEPLHIRSMGSGGRIQFFTSGSEKMRLTPDGYQRMATGTKGIQFNGDTAAANALNDYEEGTWTPTLGGGSSDPTGVTYDVQTGNYTKVGRLVTINFIMGFTTYTGGTGAVFVRGLPFACAGGNAANGAGQLEQFSFTGGRTYATLRVNSGDSVIDPQQMGASTSWTAFTHGTNITSSGTGKYITGTVTYTT